MLEYLIKNEISPQNYLSDKSYEYEKIKKKQKILRNEFLAVGKYEIPLVRKQYVDLDKIQPWCYVKAKQNDTENQQKTIHFFTYDWLYENVYNKPEEALEKLDQYYALLTPDFSCYFNMPLAMQIQSTFKNRWCGAFWQKQGMRVIPTIEWGLENSFDFAFDGVEQGSIVAVSTYTREAFKSEFMMGYNRMLEVIQPSAIVCYGDPFEEMRGNVKVFSPFNQKELIAKLGFDEYVKRYMEGNLYPSN